MENIPRNIPSRSPDLEAMEEEEEEGAGCRSGLTRTNSDSSAVSIDSSKDFSLRNANARPDQSTEWTNEKHSLYLDSLEASFVDQLHCSMGLHRWRSQENKWGPYISRELPANSHTSDKFMVLRDGCWQKVNFETSEPLLDSTADSHVILKSPWIRHFRSAGKCRTVTSPDLQKRCVLGSEGIHFRGNSSFSCERGRSSEQQRACQSSHQDLVGSIKEVSDQNFVDEHQGEKSSCMATAKRLKTAAADASNKDQIVPSGKFRSADFSTVNNGSSETEELVRHELLSEHPESFVCPESNVHYFLRGKLSCNLD